MQKEVIVKWKIKESARAEIIPLLAELAEKTRSEEGNIFYTIYQSEADPGVLILHEQYKSEAAAEAHKQTPHYQSIVVAQIIPHLEIREVTVVKKMI